MPSVQYVTLDVFTTDRFGGNPLAVIPDARGVSDTTMQHWRALDPTQQHFAIADASSFGGRAKRPQSLAAGV